MAGIAALGVAMLGGTITDLGPWYQSLAKPDWTPPGYAFPIAWTAIFALAALAAVSAWLSAPNANARTTTIGLFALNGFLNIMWSLLFFRLQRPDWAFAELVALWLSVLVLILYCGRFSRLSALALVPYLIWASIAGALNWNIVQLNGPF
ncbi:TspO/MBR family protein [Erythrobacter sp. YJ-T3-07]|uniref:TspO/MBR family protein n=1 Tax=Erythrobacter sp. YJ-T3-07 TaxID=2793063 RepID=UPI0034D19924